MSYTQSGNTYSDVYFYATGSPSISSVLDLISNSGYSLRIQFYYSSGVVFTSTVSASSFKSYISGSQLKYSPISGASATGSSGPYVIITLV